MATIDHIVLKVNDLSASVDCHVNVLGFSLEGQREPLSVIRVSEDFANT